MNIIVVLLSAVDFPTVNLLEGMALLVLWKIHRDWVKEKRERRMGFESRFHLAHPVETCPCLICRGVRRGSRCGRERVNWQKEGF